MGAGCCACLERRASFTGESWSQRARMGGPGSVHQWFQAGLGQADHTHLTSAGYRMVGDMLFSEIMSQYDRFQAAMANRTDGQ